MHKQNKSINLFYIPALILFAIFVVYPFMKGIYLSFTNWNGYSKTFKMVGFDNYIRMFSDPNVRTAIINTLIYGAGSTLIQNVLGLFLALLRTIVYLPVMIAPP